MPEPVTEKACEERRAACRAVCDERMARLKDRLDHLQTLFDQRLETSGDSLCLQAKEYERRLGEINKAHADAMGELTEWRRKVERSMAAQTWSVVIATFVAILVGAVSLIFRFWK